MYHNAVLFMHNVMFIHSEVLRQEEVGVLQRAERAMVRMMCGVKLRDKCGINKLMALVGLSEDIVTLVGKSRLRWYGHVMRREEEVGIRKVLEVEVPGVVGRGRPKMGWREQVEKDMLRTGLQSVDVCDRTRWRRGVLGFGLRQ